MKRNPWTVCVYCTLFLAFFFSQARGNDFMIVPNERIGDLSLNMDVQDIQKLLGPPSKEVPEDLWIRYSWDDQLLGVDVDKSDGRAFVMWTHWQAGNVNQYKTEKGIGIGATLDEVKQAYPGCDFSKFARISRWMCVKEGILFVIYTAPDYPSEIWDRVGSITIFKSHYP